MADRAVNVQLSLGTALYQRGIRQIEADNRRFATGAESAATAVQGAFNRASAAQVSAATAAQRAQAALFERTAQQAAATSQVIAESATRSAAATGRFEERLDDIPALFRAAGATGATAFGEISTAAVRTSLAIGQTTTAITSSQAAAATGTARLSLATRLAIAEVTTATAAAAAASAAAAAESAAAAPAQATAWGRASAAVASFGSTARAQAAAVATSMATSATTSAAAWKTVRMGGIALLAVFAAAVAAAAKFERAMGIVGAASNATGQDLETLRKAALQAGKDTSFSAKEAADAEAELARAGISVADIAGGALRASLDLAAAGQLGLAESAIVTSQAMNAFGLRGKDTARIADVIAAGAGKSATNVHDMGMAFRMAALVAQQTGLSLEDTVGTLSLFAQNALTGSDAGTSLKVMLQRLTPQGAPAARMMDQLGFSAYTANGEFVGLTELSKRMAISFGQLTPEARNAAMGVIFGSDAVRAATILYKAGEQGVRGWVNAVEDQGFATRVAKQQTDNLIGDLERLRGSIETALIESGSAANSVIREMTQFITALVNAYNDLPGPLKSTITGAMGVMGALMLVSGALVLAIPRLVAFRTAVVELSTTMPRLATAAARTTSFMFGPWGAALMAGVAVLTLFAGATGDTESQVQDLTEAVKADSNAVGTNTRAWVAHQLETKGVLKAARDLSVSTEDLTSAVLGSDEALDRVNRQLSTTRDAAQALSDAQVDTSGGGYEWVDSLLKVDDTLNGMTGQVNGAVAAARREAEATGDAANSTTDLGKASARTADSLEEQATAAEKLEGALNLLNGGNISATKGAISFQNSLAELRDAVKESGTGLDITTEKGRAVKSAFLGAAEAAMSHAKAVTEQTNSVDSGTAVLTKDIEALKATMKQAGFTQAQIASLTEAYAQLPPTVTTKVTDPGALQVIADMERARAAVENVPAGKTVVMKAMTAEAEQGLMALGYKVEHMKDGTVKVTVPTSDAFNSTVAIQGYINQLKDRQVNIRVHTDYMTTGVGPYGGKPLPLPQARGSIIEMARGGITAAADGLTTRRAAIASRPILWAEAGREAYIPMDPAKRARSTQLLDYVAKDFGYQLTPMAQDLIPARQLGGGGQRGSTSHDNSRTTTVNLYGAKQTSGEQLADLARRMEFVG